ncbi:MAG TPA: GNAT family N-acetyltransferase [Elusimicrobiota bacterium]|nr:GNAT family N-acetyltransferase [Elusimicrobiota bacterium]
MGLTVQRIEVPEFDGLQDDWNRLLRSSAADNFFLLWEWIHTWWTVFGSGRSLYILAARLDGRLVGIAPLYVDANGKFTRRRVLRFCSDELAPDYLDLIVERGFEPAVAPALFGYLADHPADWDMMILEDLLKDSILLGIPTLTRTWPSRITPGQRCPYIKLEGTFEQYVEKQRQTTNLSLRDLRRKERRLFDDEGVTHARVSDPSGLAKAVSDLFTLHQYRAEQKRIHTNFASDRILDFHRRLSGLLLKQGMLALDFLYHRHAPISATYSFQYRNKLYHYQKGMDPRWSRLSVGTILHKMNIVQAFADGLTELDLLKGDEGYKNDWANAVREEFTVTLYNRRPAGQLLRFIDRGKTLVQQHVRPCLQSPRIRSLRRWALG